MKIVSQIILLISLTLILYGCNKRNEFSGTLKIQGVTYYQYGTHTITNNGTTYTLQSNSINLDDYADQYVTIVGERVNGYPIEGGPDLFEVTAIE